MRRTVFYPTVATPHAAAAFCYAPRPRSLTGLRVGLVENTKFNSDRTLSAFQHYCAMAFLGTMGAGDRQIPGSSEQAPARQSLIDQHHATPFLPEMGNNFGATAFLGKRARPRDRTYAHIVDGVAGPPED